MTHKQGYTQTETKGYRRHRGTPTNAAKPITVRLKRFLGTLLLIPFGGSKGLFPYRTGRGEEKEELFLRWRSFTFCKTIIYIRVGLKVMPPSN